MLNGPKNRLTYTQNDREKWRNTFTMIVSASLHVLVTKKSPTSQYDHFGAQVLPRIGLSRTSYGGISLQSLYSLQLAPQISQNWWRLPPYTTCSMRPEGGPLGQAAKPRPKGCGPLPLPRGQATLHFWAVGGAMLSLTPKKSYLRLVWHQYVVGGGCGCTPVPRKKKRRKRQNKVSNPLGPNFCKAHISKLVYAPPFFLLSLRSPHRIVPKNAKKKFFTPPPENFFSGHAIIKITQTQEFSVFIS